jgi:IS4 transposase
VHDASGQQPLLRQGELGRWRLVADLQERLEQIGREYGVGASFEDRRRRLQLGHYLGLFLFGLLNPAVRTMRGLCEASHLPRLQEEVCGRPVSLGSFSEAQAVVDTRLLERVFEELTEEISRREELASGRAKRWLIQDSTLWEALPRMRWALWRRQGRSQSAVRLHLSLHVVEDKPQRAKISSGRGCERRAWRENWQPGDAYVGDRYYGEDYRLFAKLQEAGCAYVLRLREQAAIKVLEEIEVSQSDRQSGVVRQAWVVLGCKRRYRSTRVRLVWVETSKEVLLLVTNQGDNDMPAELVAALYRQRWRVELFFRWMKCILGCRHWLAESSRGVAIEIYLALIAALLLQLYSGRRPNRRMLELIQLHLLGVASNQDLQAGLERQLLGLQKRKAQKA